MNKHKQAFSFVEIIITISIITLLAVIGISTKGGYDEKVSNSKIIADVQSINNALISYKEENLILPTPMGNTNYFNIDTSYSHSSTGAFGTYGSITENTIPKKYLETLPLDPRTNSYYAYGKTLEDVDDLVKNQFEIASVLNTNGEYRAKVIGNYTAKTGPYNLIRSYNSSNFVTDDGIYLAYNPEELVLTATASGVIYHIGDTIKASSGDLEIYFSDGSVSVLENGGELILDELSFPNENNLSTLVRLGLQAGTIWTKATHLNDDSEFEVYTTDSTAAVRGTIFGVKKDSTATEVVVIDGKVEVRKNDETQTKIRDLEKDESVKVINGEAQGNSDLNNSDYEGIQAQFTIGEDARGEENITMLGQDIVNNVINEDNYTDEEIQEPVGTCEEYQETIGGVIRTISCDVDGFAYTSYSCIDSTMSFNTETMACESSCDFIVDGEAQCNEELNSLALIAYAPYNNKGNISLYRQGGQYSLNHSSVIGLNSSSATNLPSYCENNSTNKSDSFCIEGDKKGIVVEGALNNDDYIKYSNLGLGSSDNFIIEMSVKVPTDGDKHYLLHSGSDIRFFIQNGKVYFNSTSTFSGLNISSGYQKVFLIKEGNNVFVAVGDLSTKTSTNQTINNDINFIYVGVAEYGTNDYRLQFNEMIDYIKIYK